MSDFYVCNVCHERVDAKGSPHDCPQDLRSMHERVQVLEELVVEQAQALQDIAKTVITALADMQRVVEAAKADR